MTKINEILPIGSVVKLKQRDSIVMITGIYQVTESGEPYDYCGVPYPEGYCGVDYECAFNQNDIEDIVSVGFIDFERQLMVAQVAESE